MILLQNQKINIKVVQTIFLSFSSKEVDEFDLFVYSLQIGNSKFVLLYEVISGKFGSINKQVAKIENKYDDNHVQQSFARDDMI